MQIFAWKSRESDKNKRETDLYEVSDFLSITPLRASHQIYHINPFLQS